MKINQISVYRVNIPFKQPFKHATADRREAENIIIRCHGEKGFIGFGETIPRPYVTGETIDGTISIYKEYLPSLLGKVFNSPDDIEVLLSEPPFNIYNCAKCAVETAMLDLLAKEHGIPLYKYLAETIPALAKIYNGSGIFYYGGAIGLSSIKKTILNAVKMRLFGFKKVKMKLGNDKITDAKRLFWVRFILGGNIDIRVDANEAWDMEFASYIAPYLKKYKISAVEQPFPKEKHGLNKQFREISSIPLIFDESLCSHGDALAAAQNNLCGVFCVKLPKCGGFYNSLKIFKIALDNNIAIQLSCQVGESAILSAAGRHIAVLCGSLRYLEGSFDKYLLKENISTEDISFAYAGKAPILAKPGLGINIDSAGLEKIASASFDISP